MSIVISFLDILFGYYMFIYLVEFISFLVFIFENLVEIYEFLCILSLVKKNDKVFI